MFGIARSLGFMVSFGRAIHFVITDRLSSGSSGFCGIPPRPVAINFPVVDLLPGLQPWEMRWEESLRLMGSAVNPRLGSTFRLLMMTVPLSPNLELAVMSLKGVSWG